MGNARNLHVALLQGNDGTGRSDAGETALSAMLRRGAVLYAIICNKAFVLIAAVCTIWLTAFAADILPHANGRFWQTVFDESATLQWRWDIDATYAKLSVSNLLVKCPVTMTQFERIESSLAGSTTMIAPERSSETGEGLVDIVIVQYDKNDNVLAEESARLAFLPSTFTVQPVNSRFYKSVAPRLVSYDAEWKRSSADAESVALSVATDSGTAITELAGMSGYFALAPMAGTASLLFDEETTWTSVLDKPLGLIIVLR